MSGVIISVTCVGFRFSIRLLPLHPYIVCGATELRDFMVSIIEINTENIPTHTSVVAAREESE